MRSPVHRRRALLLGSALLAGGVSTAGAAGLSPTLLERAKKGDQTQVGVIVRFAFGNDSRGRAQLKNLRGQLVSRLNQFGANAGFINQAIKSGKATQLWLDQSIYLPLTPVQARALAALPFVTDVFENFKVQIPKPQRAVALSASAAAAGEPWHLAKIGAPQAWAAGFKGQGIKIGHLDSGIDASHSQLSGKLAAFAEFNEAGDRVNSQPHDTTNHGTHTAGLLVGNTVGVAPGAKIISALVLPNNEGTFAQVIAGMQYVLDPDNNADTDDGADVVNMSLGIPGTYDEFIVPVQNMLKAGVVPVFAIGNFGPAGGTTGSPGNLPDAIGVGAVDQNGQVASFSSRGPVTWNSGIKGTFTKPDIAAPGVEITSSFPGNQYGALSGSSQASPIAAGAVALLLSAKPGTSVDAIKNALYSSASNAGSKNNNVGYGLISVPGALGKLGVNVSAPAPAPQPAPAPAPQPAPAPAPQPAPAPAPQPAPSPAPQPAPTPAPSPSPAPSKQPTGPAGYDLCAVEGQKCNFSGQRQAAFGTEGRYVTGTATDGFDCSVGAWGRDPAVGLTKGCFIKPVAAQPAPAPAPKPSPAPAPAPAKQPTGPAGYELCAVEGQTCKFSGQRQAAFGTDGKYLTGTGTDGFGCTVSEWGRDPAPGLTKGCFIKPVSGQPAPQPAPAPSGNTGRKPTVLLVDDDMGQGPDVTNALRDAIKANAASGGAFVFNTQTQGQVPLSELVRADIVIWATGEAYQNTITAADQNTLRQYLARGGRLIVTGQDIGFDIGTSDFYRGTLKTTLLADSSGIAKFVTRGVLGSATYTLNAGGSAMNQYYPDVIADLNGSSVAASWGTANATAQSVKAQSIRQDGNGARVNAKAKAQRISAQEASDNAGAIVVNDAGSYRTITMGFGLEGLAPAQQSSLLKVAFDWLMK